ncbi:hypothetical protein [Streptosporangium oxazolinicum]|uniref:hypothetical protein n=1 Tax=Streptosporangium oxazolinicum TaxID=909287 RepID=UPI0031EC0EA5
MRDWTPDNAWNLAERAGYWARQGHTRHEELYRIPLSAPCWAMTCSRCGRAIGCGRPST